MKKFMIALPLVAATVFGMSAQADLSVADLLRIAEAEASADQPVQGRLPLKSVAVDDGRFVEMLVRFDDDSALDAVAENGGEIVERLTRHAAVVRTPLGQAVEVAASKGVRSASLSTRKALRNMEARAFSNVDDVRGGVNLPAPYNGEGVVVGIYDTGIDPNHINFRDADGNSRVKRVWNYKGASSIPTEYGVSTPVSSFTTDDTSESHGTHVLGIMTGSFADAADASARDYSGMAPGAEIVAACGGGYETQILGAFRKMTDYAKSQGKPCVINLSFGDNIGPHDGSDDFTATINEIAEENNALICLAAGNERDLPIALVKELTDSDCELNTLLLGSDALSYDYGQNYQSFGMVQVWGEDATPFEVSLEIISRTDPENPTYTLTLDPQKGAYLVSGSSYINEIADYKKMNIISNATAFTRIYSNSYVGGEVGVNEANGRYYADLNVKLYSTSKTNLQSTFVRLHVKGTPGKRVHVYCDGTYNEFGTKNLAGMDTFTGEGTNSNMASGEHTLCVGSYATANITGSGYNSQKAGSVSYFSSFGITPDGRVMPDICAPGQVIISSRNSYISSSYSYAYPSHYNYTDPDSKKVYRWTYCAGTSQASPHMAGVAALWLSANPNLSYTELKEIARETAAAPEIDGKGWGAGRVDAYAGIKKAIDMASVENVFETVSEPVMITPMGDGSYEIYVPGQRKMTVSLIGMSGTTVRRFEADSDTSRIDVSDVVPGIYLLSVTSPGATRTLKIAVP